MSYLRIERDRFGRTTWLYCGDSDNRWRTLTGDPEQEDILDECHAAYNAL